MDRAAVYETAALPEHNLQVHASLITAIRDRDTTALAKLRMLCRPGHGAGT